MEEAPSDLPAKPAEPPKQIHDTIAHDLGVAIVSGAYAPGDMLAGEAKFSSELKVSRGAYREAIRILAAKGLVQSRTKSGTRVRERRHWSILDLDVLAWMFETEPSETFIRDIFELRLMVEPMAAALAATRRTSRELGRMGHALEEMERFGLLSEQGRAADQAFHNLVLESTRNEAVMSLSSTISAAVGWTTLFARRERAAVRDPMPDHYRLFDALAQSDPHQARTCMIALIDHALHDAGVTSALDPALSA
ncbi:FadR/GntR family transcriptional regulator [Sphingomonas flavalba]|uniref:FadR/GntR family transcriptional regulator n=1 Tax=Sphingomonas flavalba TaxID=2559804 RepID=UPI00109E1838|nr:FadR/GntR family transcriptional regulator [Sphingomonas flavalba]